MAVTLFAIGFVIFGFALPYDISQQGGNQSKWVQVKIFCALEHIFFRALEHNWLT